MCPLLLCNLFSYRYNIISVLNIDWSGIDMYTVVTSLQATRELSQFVNDGMNVRPNQFEKLLNDLCFQPVTNVMFVTFS